MLKHSFRRAAVLLALAALAPLSGIAAPANAPAKNIILLIGDGMGQSHFIAARTFSQKQFGKDLHITGLMQKRCCTALLTNDTADALVTESAAAAGQIATGQKMYAAAVSMAADGKTPVTTIMELARQRGKATALVTTSAITDATPAAFAAHVAQRSDQASIAAQQLAFGVDVLLGGSREFFLPESAGGKRKDGRDLTAEARQAGYALPLTADELRQTSGGRVLGLFNMGRMEYEIDRAASKEPSLAQMTDDTLRLLARHPNGFVAMIEGGRIDHAAHSNDAAATIRDTLAFDEAVGRAIAFAATHPDTLIIVTADHETGGMGLIGNSKTSKQYVGLDSEAIAKATTSFSKLARQWGKSPSPDKIKEVVLRGLGIELTDAEAQTVAEDPIRKLDPANNTYPNLHSLAYVLRPYYRVGWTGQTHTAAPLFAVAHGPGAQNVGGLMHNTELFTVMRQALELR